MMKGEIDFFWIFFDRLKDAGKDPELVFQGTGVDEHQWKAEACIMT